MNVGKERRMFALGKKKGGGGAGKKIFFLKGGKKFYLQRHTGF